VAIGQRSLVRREGDGWPGNVSLATELALLADARARGPVEFSNPSPLVPTRARAYWGALRRAALVNSLSRMSQGGGSAADAWSAGFDAWAPTASGQNQAGWADALLTAGGGIASYFTTKNANKNARKLLKLQIQARALGIGAPALGSTATPYGMPATYSPSSPYTTAAYLTGGDASPSPLDSLFGGGATMPTEANVLGGLLPALVTGARALATSPRVIALGRTLLRYLPTLGAAAAVELASSMVGDGVDAGDGPYANPKHNKCTGILRGDVMAVRRVKRQGKRLLRTLRMAGAVPRSGRFRARARRR